MTIQLQNQQRPAAVQGTTTQAAAAQSRPNGNAAPAATKKRSHASKRFTYRIQATVVGELGLSMQRICKRRGFEQEETQFIRQALATAAAQLDPIFARWLNGQGDGRQ